MSGLWRRYRLVVCLREGSPELGVRGARGVVRQSAAVRLSESCAAVLCALAVAPVVARAAPSAVYVANRSSGTVSQFTGGAGGALTPLASVAAVKEPAGVAISPDGKSAYVTNFGDNVSGVSQYSVGAGGVLTTMATPTVSAGGTPFGIAVSPDGKSVYVANDGTNGAGGISQYTVGAGGALTPMGFPTVAGGNAPFGIAVSPDGKSVYVTNKSTNGAGGVSQYTVGAGGALTPMATPTVAAGDEPLLVAVTPNGRNVYVANGNANGAGGVSQYTAGADGALTPMATPTVAAGNGPSAIAVSPNGRNVYVANGNANGAGGVSQYTVGADGGLTPMATPTVAAGNGPFAIAVTPDGKSVYVANFFANGSDAVSQYDVGADGALTPKTPTTVVAGDNPDGIAVLPDQAPVASFSANSAPAGAAVSFDAGATVAADGPVASYAWDFGDGSSQTTSVPQITHVYAQTGIYTATLTVTDQIGCSTTMVFTGQTASCNGGPAARTTRQVTVASPPSVNISSPGGGARYLKGQQVARAGYRCADGAGGPGIASCAGPVPSGQPIDTSTVGRQQFTVTATSRDGQTTARTVTYQVMPPSNRFTITRLKAQRNGTIAFQAKLPGRGLVNVLERATATSRTKTTPRRARGQTFVLARARKTPGKAVTLKLRLAPNKRGKRLIRQRTHNITIELSVTYTPTGGNRRTINRTLRLPR